MNGIRILDGSVATIPAVIRAANVLLRASGMRMLGKRPETWTDG